MMQPRLIHLHAISLIAQFIEHGCGAGVRPGAAAGWAGGPVPLLLSVRATRSSRSWPSHVLSLNHRSHDRIGLSCRLLLSPTAERWPAGCCRLRYAAPDRAALCEVRWRKPRGPFLLTLGGSLMPPPTGRPGTATEGSDVQSVVISRPDSGTLCHCGFRQRLPPRTALTLRIATGRWSRNSRWRRRTSRCPSTSTPRCTVRTARSG